MSSSISIFVKTEYSYVDFVNHIEDLLKIEFKLVENEKCLSVFEGIGLRIGLIGELDYMDDDGHNIAFSDYSYQIFIDIIARVKEYDYWQQLEYYIAMYIYSRICESFAWKCIVVEDMEKLLAGN
jgi:hypothetical protein